MAHYGVPMSIRRVGSLTAIALSIVLWQACGQVYRPVVIPCSTGGVPGCPVESNPTPSNFHAVLAVSTNTPSYPGGAMQIDVSGDSIVGQTPTNDLNRPNIGPNPTHATLFPNNSKVFVASAGSVFSGGTDSIAFFNPVFQSTLGTGLGQVSTIALPPGSQPVFVNTTQNNAVYVANFGTNSVSSVNTTSNVVTNTVAVGTNPVSLAETPNAFKLYVANQASNTVSTLSPVDLSNNTASGLVTGFTGVTPVWLIARGDSQKVYVLTQGDGQLVTIDVATDTVTSSLPVGAGANFMFIDPNLNRLYVTNPVTSMVYVFSDTGGTSNGVVSDIPNQLAAIPFTAGSTPCPAGCTPVSVTALLDGSRFYVASYQSATACPDATVSGACIIPGLTVFDANSFTVKYPSAPTMSLLAWLPACTPSATAQCPTSPFATNQYAVPPMASCVTALPYSPTTTRFRLFTVAAADSSRVYVGMCDAGAIAVVNTTSSNANNTGGPRPPDTLVTDLLTAASAGPPQPSGLPTPQNPIFMLMGQ